MNALLPFQVKLQKAPDANATLLFDCKVEDETQAIHQAEKAYPGCEIITCIKGAGDLPLDSWLHNLYPGSEVWWNDPDAHLMSGYYTIDRIHDESVVSSSTVLTLKNAFGGVVEVYAGELSATKPENLYPVTNCRIGGEMYGYATSKENAINLGSTYFDDGVADVILVDDVVLRDGEQIGKAWLALARDHIELSLVDLQNDFNMATPGEWDFVVADNAEVPHIHVVSSSNNRVLARLDCVDAQEQANANFIASAHNAFPFLLDAVRQLSLVVKMAKDGDLTSDAIQEAEAILLELKA